MSDAETMTPSVDAPQPTVERPLQPGDSPHGAVGVSAIVGGAVGIWVGLVVSASVGASLQVPIVIASVVAIVGGVGRVARWMCGRRVRLALWLSVGWLVLIGLSAIFADLLPLAEARDTSKTILEPSLTRPDLLSAHPLGTDRQGLDVLGGIVYGARVSLVVGFGAVTVGACVGGLLGLLGGFYRGRVEAATTFLADSMIAFPPLILLLALVAVLDPSVPNVTAGLAILGVPIYIRLARANTLAISKREFMVSARVLGASDRRLLFREVLPNLLPSLLSYAFVVIAVMIAAEASLSYLGLSIQRPTPTWGNMIAAGQDSFDRNPHLVFGPGVVLFLTVFSLNKIGEAARAAWNPQSG